MLDPLEQQLEDAVLEAASQAAASSGASPFMASHSAQWLLTPPEQKFASPRLVRPFVCCSDSKLQPRPWWGSTLHDPGDVQQWFAQRTGTDEQPARMAPVSEIVRDRTRLAALPPVMTDFRKVSKCQIPPEILLQS